MKNRSIAVLASALALTAALSGCAHPVAPSFPASIYPAVVGVEPSATARVDLRDVVAKSRVTVVTFFAKHCACQRAHDARLRDLYARYAGRGVAVVAVDANADATLDLDRREAAARAYPFPLISDPTGDIADSFLAEVATYSVVLDSTGRVRYRGGFDSDKQSLHADATPWVERAVERLLANQSPEVVEEKPLGCSLRRP